MEQAGLSISERQFVIGSVVLGLVATLVAVIFQASLLVTLGIALVAGLGLPRWIVNYLRKKRQKMFIAEFPNAVDLIVRGVKSGLPVNDTFRMIAGSGHAPMIESTPQFLEAVQPFLR